MSSLQHLQGHPTENFEKKAYIKNKTAILAFWEIAGKKLSVPHSQQVWWTSSQPARCTYNL